MRGRSRWVTTLAVAAALTLSGCAGPSSPGDDLRTLVVSAADSAAAGDLTAAVASIDDLESRVVAARETGGLAPEEADEILATIALVRADLAALAPPEPEPTTDTPAVVPTDQAPEDSGGGDDEANDDNGNDKGNGNGKGGGKDKGEDKGKDKG